MNSDIKKQKGGFIGTLLAGLAGSLLPSLLGGKGLMNKKRHKAVTSRPRKEKRGLKRAGAKGLNRVGKD